MPMITDLQNIGLSDKEAKVYLATLELSHASVQDIAKKAGVNRATTYVILEALIKKGLASTFQHGKKTHYAAESPEVLGTVYALQKKEIEEKEKHLQNLMPQLRAIYNRQENKPVVRFFEGKEGLLTMSEEVLGTQDAIVRMIYSVDEVQKIFNEKERSQAKLRRLNKNIKTKVLYTFRSGELSSSPDGERIRIPEAQFPISCDIALFDGKVRIASLGKRLSGVIIQDEDIYKTLVSIFELAWEAAQARAATKIQPKNPA